MPRIFKLVLGLAVLVIRGLNPAAGEPPALAQPRPLNLPQPISRNPALFEWPQTPIASVTTFSASPSTPDPVSIEAETRKARQIKIIATIDKIIKDKNKHKPEYYLDQGTFVYLHQQLQKAQKLGSPEDLAAIEYAYYIHFEAYQLLRQEHKNLPKIKNSLLSQYETLRVRFASNADDPIAAHLIERIKRKFKREVTPRELGMVSMGSRLQPEYANALHNGFKNPKENFETPVLLHVLREIMARSFQFDYETLSYVLKKINEPEVLQFLPPEAIIIAQFTALTFKKETDYAQSEYYFDEIMSAQWPSDEFNRLMDKSGLNSEEIMSVMDVEMPEHIHNMYVHYMTTKYPVQTVSNKVDEGQSHVSRTPYLAAGTFSLLISGLLGRYAYKKWSAPGAAQDEEPFQVSKHKKKEHKRSNAPVTAAATTTPAKNNGDENKDKDKNKDEDKDKNQDKEKERKREIEREREKERIKALEKKRTDFLALITAEHIYARKNDLAYIKTYQSQINAFKNPSEKWLNQSNVDQLHEFIEQMKLSFKLAELNYEEEDNDIIRALIEKYKALKSAASTESSVVNHAFGSQRDEEKLISDDYFPYTYDDIEPDLDDTPVEKMQPNKASSSSSSSSSPAKITIQYDNQNTLSVKPYLDAFNSETSPIVLKHAYKLLIIKFHEAYKNKFHAESPALQYFRRLRNALAHDDLGNHHDLATKLYIILITVERVQTEGADWSDLNNHIIALEKTLSPHNRNKKPEPAKDKFQRLTQELNEIYTTYYSQKEKLLHNLALINVFAEIAEVLNQEEMQAQLKNASKDVHQAFKKIREFRNTEYHSGHLRQDIGNVQIHYIVLMDYMKTDKNINKAFLA